MKMPIWEDESDKKISPQDGELLHLALITKQKDWRVN